MAEVVQVKCPKCKNLLRLPPAWVGKSLRCKFCQAVIHLKAKPAAPPPVPAAKDSVKPPASESVKPALPAKPPAAKTAGSTNGPSPFNFDDLPDEPATPRRRAKRNRKSAGTWWKGALLGGCIVAVVAALGVLFGPSLLYPGKTTSSEKKFAEANGKEASSKQQQAPPPGGEEEPFPEDPPELVNPPTNKEVPKVEIPPVAKPPIPVNQDPFPRRALLIAVANYLYANPSAYGKPATDRFAGSSTAALRNHLVNVLHVPANQVAELSDRGSPPRPPLKPAIESTVSDFLKSSRAQDRVVLFFAGHAVEIEKEAYLVPQEGDPDDPAKLIPLRWLYDRLLECKARQKVLIVDVCRLDPVRGGEPMGDVLGERLRQAPAGVQVWSACSPKQNSHEADGGSVFLAGLCHALRAGLTIQSQGNPLPVDFLLPRVNAYLTANVRGTKAVQMSRLTGKEADEGADYDPSEAPAPPVRVLAGLGGKGEFASRALVEGIMEEINAVPAAHAAKGRPREIFPFAAMMSLPAKKLLGYEADYKSLDHLKRIVARDRNSYPLRAAVLDALKEMTESAYNLSPRESFAGTVTDQLKKQIHAEQRAPAQMIANLERALVSLEKAGKDRAKEPSKRWQANYDLTAARLKGRLVVLYEYNNLLAQIRGDSLPPLTDGANGYVVGHRKKVQVPEGAVKTWVKEIAATWSKILREHPDTPWAVIARREQSTLLGLEWRPNRP